MKKVKSLDGRMKEIGASVSRLQGDSKVKWTPKVDSIHGGIDRLTKEIKVSAIFLFNMLYQRWEECVYILKQRGVCRLVTHTITYNRKHYCTTGEYYHLLKRTFDEFVFVCINMNYIQASQSINVNDIEAKYRVLLKQTEETLAALK